MAQKKKPISQAKNWKAQLVKDLDADLKKRHRGALKKLRETIAGVRKVARGKLARLRATCPPKAKARVEKIREQYRAARAKLRARFRALRAVPAAKCRACQVKIRDGVVAKLAPLASQVTHEKALLAPLLELDRLHRRNAKGRHHATVAAEKRRESDDQVESDIYAEDPALVPVWRRVKATIKGRPGMSRREQFLHMVHEDPQAILEIRQEIAEHALEEELAAFEAQAHDEAPPASTRRPVTRAAPKGAKGGPRKTTGRKRQGDGESAAAFFARLSRGAVAA